MIAADQPVTVQADGRAVIPTEWDEGFLPDQEGLLEVRDARGLVVARDGQILSIPESGLPSLFGHLVCVSERVVWIFDEPVPGSIDSTREPGN